MDKNVMYKMTYGLFILSARDGMNDNGCIINTAIQSAFFPPRISICVNKENYTHDMIVRTGAFTVSILSEKADFDMYQHFGFNSGRDVNKFAEFLGCKRGKNGIYYITRGTNAYISAKVDMAVDLGSHTMFAGTITDMENLSDDASATYDYYLNFIKPKPDYNQDVVERTVWRCRVCGTEYDGDELPEYYFCPICKHPSEDFEKVSIKV